MVQSISPANWAKGRQFQFVWPLRFDYGNPDQPPTLAPAPETARPPIQEILPPAELQRLKDSADARKREVRKVLDQMGSRRLNSQRETVSRIRSFLQLSDNVKPRTRCGMRMNWPSAPKPWSGTCRMAASEFERTPYFQ